MAVSVHCSPPQPFRDPQAGIQDSGLFRATPGGLAISSHTVSRKPFSAYRINHRVRSRKTGEDGKTWREYFRLNFLLATAVIVSTIQPREISTLA